MIYVNEDRNNLCLVMIIQMKKIKKNIRKIKKDMLVILQKNNMNNINIMIMPQREL